MKSGRGEVMRRNPLAIYRVTVNIWICRVLDQMKPILDDSAERFCVVPEQDAYAFTEPSALNSGSFSR